MRVLLDNNVNHRFARLISGHEVVHARSLGLRELHNGELIVPYGLADYATGFATIPLAEVLEAME